MNETQQKYSLDELCSLVDLPRRTIRYYIQVGLVDKPEGAKRGAYYVQRHVEQILEIRKWQQAGLSLERIRDLLAGSVGEGPLPPPRRRHPGDVEVWSHLYIREGVELHIDPKQAGMSPEAVRELARGVMALVKKVAKEERET